MKRSRGFFQLGWIASLVLTAFASAGEDDPAAAIESLLRNGEPQAALDRLKSSKLPPSDRARLEIRALHALQEWSDAVDVAKAEADRRPDDVEAQLLLAETLRTKMENLGGMRAMWTVGSYKKALAKARRLDPKHVGALTEEIGYFIYAPAIAGGDKKRAEKLIGELEALDLGAALQMKALLAAAQDDDTTRVQTLERLVELRPDDVDAAFQLGLAHQTARRFEQADPLFARLAQHDDQAVAGRAVYQLGRSRVLGEYELEQAVAHFDRYLGELSKGASPRSRASAHWRRGQALAGLGRNDEARRAFETALELEPDLKQARTSLRKLGR